MSKKPAKRVAHFKVAHVGLKFDQSDNKKEHDIRIVFSRGYDWITGTEAGPGAGKTQLLIREYASRHGYVVNLSDRYGTWVAVKRSLIYSGLHRSERFAILGSKKQQPAVPGKFGDKGVVYIKFNMGSVYGNFMVGAAHFVTQSAVGSRAKKLSFDRKYVKAIEKLRLFWARRGVLQFLGVDANWDDEKYDLFQGGSKFITCWDEMGSYPSTGDTRLRQTISAICRASSSKRVWCLSAMVLNDKKLFLNTDHYLIEAVYAVQALR